MSDVLKMAGATWGRTVITNLDILKQNKHEKIYLKIRMYTSGKSCVQYITDRWFGTFFIFHDVMVNACKFQKFDSYLFRLRSFNNSCIQKNGPFPWLHPTSQRLHHQGLCWSERSWPRPSDPRLKPSLP